MAALAWLSAAWPLAAQTTGFPERWSELADTIFRNYGPDEGLPLSSVTSFAEDGDGFLWVGTQGGLARWDGYHFRVYHSDPSDPGALQNEFVWCLQKDVQGHLWIGTNGGGLSRYDRATDKFVTFTIASPERGSIPVRALADDGSGGMWVGSDRGLDHFSSEGTVINHEQHEDANLNSLPGDQVLALLRDRSGQLWVGTNEGLARRNKENSGFASIPLNADKTDAPSITRLLEATDGRIWVGTRSEGAYVFDSFGRVTKGFRENPPGLERMTVQAIAEPVPGTLWFGTDGRGIAVLNAASGRVTRILHDPSRTTSLPHDFIFSFYHDRGGLLWTGTYSGMGVHDSSQDAVLTAFGGSNQTQGLTGADVLATLATRDGKIWVTYLAGGADILDPAGQRLATLRPDPIHPQGSVPPDRIRALAQTGNGDVYLGTYHGLYRADSKGSHIVHLPLSRDAPTARVLSLLSDSTGLWIGTYADGLWHLDNGSSKPRRYAVKGLTDQWISALAPASDGRLWVGSYQGLYLFDPVSEQLQRSLSDSRDPLAKSGWLISSLLNDRRGRLWASTLDGGIAVSDGLDSEGKPRFRRIGMAEGLTDRNVDSLVEDKSGAIWGSTGNGFIARVDPDSFSTRIFQRADGIGLRGFAMNASSLTTQGELLFGGDGGLTIIRSDRLKPRTWIPPVAATDLRVGGRSLPSQAYNGTGPKPPIQILPDANSLSVEFAALDYSAPDRNRYAYRLEGYDDDWVTTDSTRRLASYTNLQPGRYTLHLRGSNRDGVWAETTLDIPIQALPAWYQTIWFRVGLAILGVFAVWFLVRIRTSYLRHRQLMLEQQVTQRTTELRESNSQLEARTAELGQSLREVAESRTKVANLLDTSGQGFFSFGADLIVELGCSRACAFMLGRAPEGRLADEVLFAEDPAKAELFRKVVSGAMTTEDAFKRDLLFSLLPSAVERRGRLLKAEYKRLDNGHVMVVLTDITEEQRLSRRIENERLRLAMIVTAVTESRDFFDAVKAFRQFFRQDLMQILAARAAPLSVYQEIYRQVHTLKGTLAQFCFDASPKMLDGLEESLSTLKREEEHTLTTGKIVELVLSVDYHGALETDLSVLRDALGEEFLEHGKGIFLPMSQARQLRAIAETLLSGESLDLSAEETHALFVQFRNLDKISLADALAAYDRVIGQVAKRLNKEVTSLFIDGGDGLWIDPELYSPFLRSLVHVFRNAIVHGIEDPEERVANGKDPTGRIDCAIKHQGSNFTLLIADDGAGIDLEALRDKAVSLDLMSAETAAALADDEAISLIFADNVSVKDHADELAGRGVGLAAVRAEVQALGGTITVTSSLGHGTRFLFSFPLLENIGERPLIDAENV